MRKRCGSAPGCRELPRSDTCFVAHNAGLDEIRTELCDRLLDLMANAGCIDAVHRARLWNEFLAHLAAWRTTTARW